MAKRFHDSGLWNEDWFIELTPEFKLFYQYLIDNWGDGSKIIFYNSNGICAMEIYKDGQFMIGYDLGKDDITNIIKIFRYTLKNG